MAVTQISAGTGHSLAVKSNGSVVGWGLNDQLQSTIPTGLDNATAISAGDRHSLALKSDQTVIGWGGDDFGKATPPVGLTGVIAISAAEEHSLALKSDGTVVGWGDNSSGQITIPSGLTGVDAISAVQEHSLALKSDGTVVGWGDNGFGQVSIPAGLTGVTAISAGNAHGLALKSDQTVVAWGLDSWGQSTIPPGLTDVIAISAGNLHSLALKSDGTVVGWGRNSNGQVTTPPGLTDVIGISGGSDYSLALKSDGGVVGWGNDSFSRASPPGSVQSPVVGSIDATLLFSADFSNDVIGVLGASLDFTAKFSGFQDWVSSLPAIQIQEVYRLVITGAPDGLQDLAIGQISSWQATNQAGGRSSYLQAVIPAAGALLPDIEARQSGQLTIQRGYKFSDGSVRFEEIMRSSFDTLRPDRGGRAITITVSGYLAKESLSFGERTLTGIRSISSPNGKRRVRCEVDTFLQPGMTVTALGETFTADFINYYVSQTDKFCEVSER